MRSSRILHWLLFLLVGFTSLGAAVGDAGSISGVARDGEGKPLAGAGITLVGRQAPHTSYHVASGPSGEYRFAGLADGEYSLDADLSGYAEIAPKVVLLNSSLRSVTADLVLARVSSSTGGSGAASGASAPSPPPIQFQSSGIRGLIDPGGYSASTGSAAATGILRGIAEVKRTDTNFAASAAKDWPCRLEPELRRAVAEHPDQFEANRRLGQFYASHDQPAKAVPLLKRALEIHRGDDTASRELAVAWLESGNFDDARRLLITLTGDNDRAEIHQLLARAEEGLGMFQQAAQEYRTAETEEPSEESLFGVGYESILAGSVADGVTAFETGIQQHPRSIALRIGAGTGDFLEGKTSEAVLDFLEATDIDPADPRAYTFLAVASGISNDEGERVRDTFKRFLDRNPDSANANYFYALALSREASGGNQRRIETLLQRAVRLDPNLAKAHLQLADTYAQRNDYNDAVPEYEATVRLAHDLGKAHYRLAMAYQRVGRAEESSREMQLFLLSKQRETAGSEGIDLAQFISVMDAPGQDSHREIGCPAAPR